MCHKYHVANFFPISFIFPIAFFDSLWFFELFMGWSCGIGFHLYPSHTLCIGGEYSFNLYLYWDALYQFDWAEIAFLQSGCFFSSYVSLLYPWSHLLPIFPSSLGILRSYFHNRDCSFSGAFQIGLHSSYIKRAFLLRLFFQKINFLYLRLFKYFMP